MHSLSSHLESLGLSHDTGRAYVQAMRWFLDYVIIWRYMRGTGKKSMDDARGIFKALIPLAAKRNKQNVLPRFPTFPVPIHLHHGKLPISDDVPVSQLRQL